jgi:hypothetical protein
LNGFQLILNLFDNWFKVRYRYPGSVPYSSVAQLEAGRGLLLGLEKEDKYEFI